MAPTIHPQCGFPASSVWHIFYFVPATIPEDDLLPGTRSTLTLTPNAQEQGVRAGQVGRAEHDELPMSR